LTLIVVWKEQLDEVVELTEVHLHKCVGWLESDVPFQHNYGYIRDEKMAVNETSSSSSSSEWLQTRWLCHDLHHTQAAQLVLGMDRSRYPSLARYIAKFHFYTIKEIQFLVKKLQLLTINHSSASMYW